MSLFRHEANWISPEEYLDSEPSSEERREYLDGQVYAMAASSAEHNLIAGDIFAALHNHLRGKQCVVFMNDVKAHVRMQAGDWSYYPDVLVNCDPNGRNRYFCDTASVIFEVLSPSTQRIDEREKFLVYQAIPALQTYVLGSRERRAVRVYRRATLWNLEEVSADGALPLPELDFTLSMDAIYERAERMKASAEAPAVTGR